MDISDGADRSWDHPWTTEEMRKRRREWSLAGDAGLLKHLQQFSETLVSKANKTQNALHSLASQLNETAILIDNVTNTSLALANTQFIESRVQEDDIEVQKEMEDSIQESKDQNLSTAELIANVTESVQKGLSIMDEKYRRMEVVDSDSEEEDDAIVLSVILGPNDPYQDRPLPYVIGGDKWKLSNKIGLESSSSESEQLEEEEEESESDKNDMPHHNIFHRNKDAKISVGRLSSSSSESDNYSDQRNDVAYINNGKLDGIVQDNIDSISESATPVDNVAKVSGTNDVVPNFAEELAKRLGTVRQAQKPMSRDQKQETSGNWHKDDIFIQKEAEDMFSEESENVFNVNKGLFDDHLSTDLWKEKPIKPFNSNIIPPSIDIPPPISSISTKPKSAIDDLFADADSEGSDDIFSSKNSGKKVIKDTVKGNVVNAENVHKKYLNIATGGNIATSTPETNEYVSSIFSDEENDEDLFSTSGKQLYNPVDLSPPSKKKPVRSVSILENAQASDTENNMSSRILRRPSSSTSGSETPTNYENGKSTGPPSDISRNAVLDDNISDRNSIVVAGNMSENAMPSIENTNSSGISIQPPSINNTGGSSIGADFQPQMTSSRLRSEEIYRERVTSDSLFVAPDRDPRSANPNSNLTHNYQEGQTDDTSSVKHDDVFDNEDLFGPPPLPKSGAKPSKTKVSSLFDDSDSGDELFSTTSSGSRSQKSTDFLVITPQYPDKAKSVHRKGLFDEDTDIFGTKESPDVDIFGTASKLPTSRADDTYTQNIPEVVLKGSSQTKARGAIAASEDNREKVRNVKLQFKKTSLFDDDNEDDGDLFSVKSTENELKVENRKHGLDDDSALFLSKSMIIHDEQNTTKHVHGEMERSIEPDDDDGNISVSEKKRGEIISRNGLFESATDTRSLLFEDEDSNDIFARTKTKAGKEGDIEKSGKSVFEEERTIKGPIIEAGKVGNLTESSPSDLIPTAPIAVSSSNVSANNSVHRVKKEEDKEILAANVATSCITNIVGDEIKKSPPKTLDIRSEVSSPPPDENAQVPRRSVSGKIKNLMGKMGDLKILSPMDTPPLWRKSDEKADECDVIDRDSDDGGCISTHGRNSPPSISESTATSTELPSSSAIAKHNTEVAISFDEPAQVETLSTAASKTRVRIQAKRRPQSRHARKFALRHSGIDFDTVDHSENSVEGNKPAPDTSTNITKEPSTNLNATHAVTSNDRLNSSVSDNLHRITDSAASLAADDKSEIGSISKESSMSANKNTLLSPSTDEEDLFDVPPDLPEDPQKDDVLFGRAPILSPVDAVLSGKVTGPVKPLRDTLIGRTDVAEGNYDDTGMSGAISSMSRLKPTVDFNVKVSTGSMIDKNREVREGKAGDDSENESADAPIDPLRDDSHDPLKDPSQLFAFVTKTPSPEKGKNLLFSEDDSLFSSGSKKIGGDRMPKRQILDLFSDETEADLFSVPLAKPVKKPLKDTKISLFDDDAPGEEDDSLFGSTVKKTVAKSDTHVAISTALGQRKINLFEDNDNDSDLFDDQPGQSWKEVSAKMPESVSKYELFSGVSGSTNTLNSKEIFDDVFINQSSGEDDIFAAKTANKKVIPSKSLFPTDDDDDDPGQIFEKPLLSTDVKFKIAEHRPILKKTVTRDLKKTAEKISEDPLSILQDDT